MVCLYTEQEDIQMVVTKLKIKINIIFYVHSLKFKEKNCALFFR